VGIRGPHPLRHVALQHDGDDRCRRRFSFEAVPVGRYDVLVHASSGDWVSTVMALGELSDRFAVEEGAATDLGSVDLAPAG
jgi:hypothetical protein